MARLRTRLRELVVAGGLCLGVVAAAWAQPEPEVIGVITAIQGAATVTHQGSPVSARLAVRQALRVHDTIETGAPSKITVLLPDDTMLTMGPRTHVEIDEYLHAPDQQVRRMAVRLTQGTMRALVGRAFSGLGSTFVVQTGTVSVIADAAYCVVWHQEQEMGVVNIGSSGAASVVAGGRVVMLKPGFYSIVPTGKPPAAAAPINSGAPLSVRQAIGATAVGDDPGATVNELAEQEIEEELRACPPDSPPGGICPRKAPPAALSPATPPAVTSGAKRR